MDRIRIEGIECSARLGVPAWERRRPQKIRVDLCLELDLSAAARKDALGATVDYWTVERLVRRLAAAGECRLAEHLAWKLGRAALESDARIRSVRVVLRKKPAVMPRTREVVVELTLRRSRRRKASPRAARRRRRGAASGRGGR